MLDIRIPNEEIHYSVNFDAGRTAAPRLIVVHATRGPAKTLAAEYLGTIAFCARRNENKNSCPHYVVGPTRVCRMVHDGDRAWHAGYLNPRSLGIEVAQPAWLPPFTEDEYLLAAQITAAWCNKYGIPPVRVRDENLRGIIGHEDTAQGKGTDKSDPGAKWDWAYFLERVAYFLEGDEPPLEGDPWAGVGSGLADVGRAHPEWGTPNPRALAAHYFDLDHDEVVKLTTGDWLLWRHYTKRWIRVPWSEQS